MKRKPANSINTETTASPSPRRELFSYITFSVLGMLGLSCYILADTFFVARGLGSNGLTALNLAIPIYSFVHGCGLLCGMGGATKFAMHKAQRDDARADRAFTNAVYISALFVLIFVLMGLILPDALTRLLGADEAVYASTRTYLQMILLFAPAFITNDLLLCFVRNDGAPRLAMLGMLLGSFANILLDYVFIFPLQMGIFGAVLATGLAPIWSLFTLLVHLLSKRRGFHLHWQRPSLRHCVRLLPAGVPSLVTEVSGGVVMMVLNMLILRLMGNLGVAAYGVVANLSLVVTALFTGVAQGAQPMISRLHGAGNAIDARRCLRDALALVCLASALLYALFFFAAAPIVSAFNSEGNAQLASLAQSGMRLYFIATPFVGASVVLCAFFAATEREGRAQLLSILRGFLLILPMALLLSHLWGMAGIWLCYPITEATVALLGLIFLVRATNP